MRRPRGARPQSVRRPRAVILCLALTPARWKRVKQLRVVCWRRYRRSAAASVCFSHQEADGSCPLLLVLRHAVLGPPPLSASDARALQPPGDKHLSAQLGVLVAIPRKRMPCPHPRKPGPWRPTHKVLPPRPRRQGWNTVGALQTRLPQQQWCSDGHFFCKMVLSTPTMPERERPPLAEGRKRFGLLRGTLLSTAGRSRMMDVFLFFAREKLHGMRPNGFGSSTVHSCADAGARCFHTSSLVATTG